MLCPAPTAALASVWLRPSGQASSFSQPLRASSSSLKVLEERSEKQQRDINCNCRIILHKICADEGLGNETKQHPGLK